MANAAKMAEKIEEAPMPPAPLKFDPVTLSKYFNQVEALDPKGQALGKEVSEFADMAANANLLSQGFSEKFWD